MEKSFNLERETFVNHNVYRFAVVDCLKHESVIVVQRRFLRHLNIARHGSFPKRDTIITWVQNSLTSALSINLESRSCTPSVKTLPSVERVTVLCNPAALIE